MKNCRVSVGYRFYVKGDDTVLYFKMNALCNTVRLIVVGIVLLFKFDTKV